MPTSPLGLLVGNDDRSLGESWIAPDFLIGRVDFWKNLYGTTDSCCGEFALKG